MVFLLLHIFYPNICGCINKTTKILLKVLAKTGLICTVTTANCYTFYDILGCQASVSDLRSEG